MPKKFIQLILACLCVIAVGALVGRGSMMHMLVSVFLAFWVGGAVLILGGLFWGIFWMKKKPIFRVLAVRSFFLALLLASQVLSLFPGKWIHQRDVVQAKNYCESLVPTLEAYKSKNGHYPEKIDTLEAGFGKRPFLLKNDDYFYVAIKEGQFSFNFLDSGSFMGTYHYDAQKNVWEYHS